MTISSTVRIAGPYIGSGAATVFPFAFKVFAAAEMQVAKLNTTSNVEIILVLNTDYTVQLNGDQNGTPGGTITLLAVLPSGYNLTITSDIANLQPTDLTNQGGFYPEVITDALDRATIQIQQLDQNSRAIKIPLSDGVLDMTTPVVAERQGKYLAFDSLGLPVVSSGTGSDSALRTDLANATAVSAGSRLSGFRQTGTGATARTVDAKLKDTFNIMDYAQGSWVPNDITKDFTPTFAAAIAAVAADGGGVLEFVGSTTYYFLTRPPEITGGVSLSGNFARIRKRYIETGTGTYAGAEGTKRGVFSFLGNTNNFTFIENFTFQNQAWDGVDDTGNGSAISIVADAGNTFGPGLIWIRNIHCSADTTGLPSPANYIWWKSCIYLDGSEVRTAPIGVRGVYISDCSLFTPAIAAIEAYAALHLFCSDTESNVGRTGCVGVKIDGGLKDGTGLGAQTDRPMFSNCDFQSVFGFKIGTESSVTHSYVQSPIVTGTIGQLELGAQALYPLLVGSQTNTLTIDPSVLYTLITENGCALNGTTTINGLTTINSFLNAPSGNVTGFRFPTGVTTYGIACAGATDSGIASTIPFAVGESIRFSMGSSKLFVVATGNGASCLVFADYLSAAVSLVSNPTAIFTNATGTPERISITKVANSHQIRIFNEYTATAFIVTMCAFGSTPTSITLGV